MMTHTPVHQLSCACSSMMCYSFKEQVILCVSGGDADYRVLNVGALPEVLNCRLAMLGFFWAVIAENVTGKNLFEQVKLQPTLIATVVALITIASAVPFYKGVRRSGNPIFTPDAEIWNGR